MQCLFLPSISGQFALGCFYTVTNGIASYVVHTEKAESRIGACKFTFLPSPLIRPSCAVPPFPRTPISSAAANIWSFVNPTSRFDYGISTSRTPCRFWPMCGQHPDIFTPPPPLPLLPQALKPLGPLFLSSPIPKPSLPHPFNPSLAYSPPSSPPLLSPYLPSPFTCFPGLSHTYVC